MAKRPTTVTIGSGFYGTTQLNNNFSAIDTAFDNTLSRDGSTPNSMSADIDMNNNNINNVSSLSTTGLVLNGVGVTPLSIAATPAASAIAITDAGAYYVGADVEAALQELGASTTSSAAITGGTIDGAVIGGTTPAAGSFTTLSTTGAGTLNSLSVTGAVDVAADIQHTGDTDNKFTFGTDTQDFQTGGSSRMDISDSGVRLGGANSRVTTILDEDTLVSDSATALATQQSIKAYVDNAVQVSRSGNLGSLALSTTYTFSHGLGVEPDGVIWIAQCTTADDSWDVGDRMVMFQGQSTSSSNSGFSIDFDGTTSTRLHTGATFIAYFVEEDNTRSYMDPGSWDLYAKCWYFG